MASRRQNNKSSDSSTKVALISAIAAIVVATITGIFGLWQRSSNPASQPTTIMSTSLYTPTLSLSQSSYFDEIDEGWTLDAGSLGASNGFLKAVPLNDNFTSYYHAPPKYYGDWRQYSKLSLDLSSSGGEYYTHPSSYILQGDIHLANGRMTADFFLPHRPKEDWESFVVSLRDGEKWTIGGGATSLNDILVNVTNFQIRAEYGTGKVADSSGLDNVILVE